MKKMFSTIRKFLINPKKIKKITKSRSAIWIDFREYDEDIINFFNKKIGNKMELVHKDNKKVYGNDIILNFKNKSYTIPYKEVMKRDITIAAINEVLKPEYEVRWFMESLGDDTLGFIILETYLWEILSTKFGKDKLDYYFFPVKAGVKMFDLSIDEISKILELRKKNKNVDQAIIFKFAELEIKEITDKRLKMEGEIDLKTYFQRKKELQNLKEKIVTEYGIVGNEVKTS